jgi:uncharacterized membrane protein
VVLGVFVGVFA